MGGFVIIMYSKKVPLEEGFIKQSIISNSTVSKDLVDKIRELYSVIDYTDATKYLFGDPNIVVTELTVFQAKMLITHAELLSTVIKEKREKDITPKKNIKPYRDIWNTFER